MEGLDKLDRELLMFLQEDCRMSLTDMAKRLDRSVDAVRKRLDKLRRMQVFKPQVQIRPRALGFPVIVDVKIKLRDYDERRVEAFISHLMGHERVAELFSLSGEWDFTAVIVAKDHEDLGEVTGGIRKRFPGMIGDWSESLTKIAYKFERYDLHKLLGDAEPKKRTGRKGGKKGGRGGA